MHTTTQHTPGPWIAATYAVGSVEHGHIANAYNEQLEDEGAANARLIAAAPDLLAALTAAVADLEGILPEFDPSGDREHPAWKTLNEARAALVAARGH